MSVSSKEAPHSPENLPDSIIVPFQAIFKAMGETPPKPRVRVGLGGYVEGPIPTSLRIDFNAPPKEGVSMEAGAYFPVEWDKIKGTFDDPEEERYLGQPGYHEFEASPGKMIVVLSEPGSAGSVWKLLLDEEKTMEALNPHFSPDHIQSMHFLEIALRATRLLIDFTSPRLSPDSRLVGKIFVPQIEIWRYSRPLAPEDLKHEKFRVFTQAVLKEMGPIWNYRHDSQREIFTQDPEALKVLGEEQAKAQRTLQILAGIQE